MFCTAWPDAPITRLSSAEPIIARPGTRSDTTPMNVMLEPRTCRAIEAPNRSRVYAIGPRYIGLRLAIAEPLKRLAALMWVELRRAAKLHASGLCALRTVAALISSRSNSANPQHCQHQRINLPRRPLFPNSVARRRVCRRVRCCRRA
jgi:hypothetical protein